MNDFIANFVHPWVLPAAKILFALILAAFSFFGLLLLVNYRKIMHNLQEMEETANQTRDDAMFNFTIARANLQELKSKISLPLIREVAPTLNEVLTHAGALAMLVIKKDPNLFKWGTTITKLAKSAFGYFKGKSYNM